MPEIDSLEIKIGAEAKKANTEIDKLITKLGALSKSLGGIDANGLQKLSGGVSTLASSMQKFQGIKLSDFNRIAKGIQKFEIIDATKLTQLSSILTPLATGIATLSATKFDNKGLTNFINALTRLSNSNVSGLNSVNFSQLGANINSLTSVLNNSKSVASNTIQIVNAVARLASAGDKAQITSASLPALGSNLSKLISTLAKAGTVSENTIQFASALGLLASAGNRTAQTAASLDILATELKKFMQVMSTAPAVSGSVIQMTQALGQLASVGNRVGGVSRGLASSLNNYSQSAKIASKHTFDLSSFIGKLYAKYWVFFRLAEKILRVINISSDLTEVQNVVVNTFGQYTDKVEELSKDAIYTLGMSELSFKQFASQYQSMGIAMGIPTEQIAKANDFLAQTTNGYVKASDSLADVSLNLTKLAGDMASFYNVDQASVAEDLRSVYTGMVVPLRKYGLDLTQTTLKEWAMNNGLNANIESMTQAEKTMLRYQYVMANTEALQGDFARTSKTFANQTRILEENFKRLAVTWGNAGVNLLNPLIIALNKGLDAVINFSESIVNALGAIFGWKLEIQRGTIADDFDNASVAADDLASGTGKAADNAKKLKQQLQGFDELNVLNFNDKDGKNGKGSGSGADLGLSGSSADLSFKIEEREGLYESEIKNLEQLGEYINNALTNTLKGIDWDNVYQGGKDFGKGLADFLNGLISPELFGELGKTIAGSLNTVIYSALSFGKNFDFKDFGFSLVTGINNFFRTYDFKALGQTYNVWVNGILDGLIEALDGADWANFGKSLGDFLSEIDIPDIASKLYKVATKIITGLGEALLSSFETAPLETAIVTVLGGLKLFGAGEALGGAISAGLSSGISLKALKVIITATVVSVATKAGSSFGGLLSNLAGDDELAKYYDEFELTDIFDYSLDEYADALKHYGNEFAKWAGFKDKSLSDKSDFDRLQDQLDALSVRAAVPNAIANSFVKTNKVLKAFGVDTKKIGAITAMTAIKIRLFGNAFDFIADSVPEYERVIKDGVTDTFNGLKNSVNNAISFIGKKLNTDYPSMLVGASRFTEQSVLRIGASFDSLNSKVTESVGNTVDSLNKKSEDLSKSTLALARNVSNGYNVLNEALNNSTSNIGSTIYNSFENTRKNVGKSLSQLNIDTSNQLSKTRSTANTEMQALYNVGTSWSMDFRKSFDYQMSYMPDSVKTYVGNSKKQITGTSWVGAGKDLVSGLIKGIEEKWGGSDSSSLVGKTKSLATDLTNTIKKAFGIHSPSKIWDEEIGQFLPPGISVGMEKAMPTLLSNASEMATSLTDTFNSSIEFSDPLKDLTAMSNDIASSINTDVSGNISTSVDMGRMSTDIAKGIVDGMAVSQADQNRLLREQNDLLRQLLVKETGITSDDIYNTVVRKNRDVFNRTGLTPLTI